MNLAKYGSVFNIGLQNTFVYRWNYFLRALFGLIPLAGTVFLWRAIFREPGGKGFRDYLQLPSSAATYLLSITSLIMAAFIQFFITYSLAMMAFWVLEISTIVFIVYSFEYFLGGQMFPVDIMPIGVQAVMKWLPFY